MENTTTTTVNNSENDSKLSMKDFEAAINNSFKKLNDGDIVTATVIGVSDTEVMVDLGYYTEGIIPIEELSNNPQFSIKADIAVGDIISAYVIGESEKNGNIVLSKKKADNILSWDTLIDAYKSKKVFNVKISQITNSGVITYLEGIRAFIPASQITTSYVDNLNFYVGKYINVIIITAEPENNKLILSGKEVERQNLETQKANIISHLQKGIVTTGTIDKITTYGAFVNIGDGLSGLVHISQICGRHIKSPNEEVKIGQEVTVKIIDIKDGKISLSMKAVAEQEEIIEDIESTPIEYSCGDNISTSLAGLFANIHLDK